MNTDHDERRSLTFVRATTVVVGLLPIVLAIYTPNVLQVTFLAKAIRDVTVGSGAARLLRALVWHARRCAVEYLGSLVATIGWFLLGNPFGIDNAYVALVVPLVVMGASSTDVDAEQPVARRSRQTTFGRRGFGELVSVFRP